MSTQVTPKETFKVGDIVKLSYGSVSTSYKVLKTTAKTITVQRCGSIQGKFYKDGGYNLYTQVDTKNLIDEPHTYRLRKDGTYRPGSFARAPRFQKNFPKDDGFYYNYLDLTA